MSSAMEMMPAGPVFRPRNLHGVGARMAAMILTVGQQRGRVVDAGLVANINETLRDWDEASASLAAIRTWRERIGRGRDFPLHAPTDVERAMNAEIAELRAALAAAAAVPAQGETGGDDE